MGRFGGARGVPLAGCAPVVSLRLGAGIRTSHPSGSRRGGAGDGSAPPLARWFVPPENRRFQAVSKHEGQFERLPLPGRQHLRAHDLGASREDLQKRWETGANQPERVLSPSTYCRLPISHLDQPKACADRNGTWSRRMKKAARASLWEIVRRATNSLVLAFLRS